MNNLILTCPRCRAMNSVYLPDAPFRACRTLPVCPTCSERFVVEVKVSKLKGEQPASDVRPEVQAFALAMERQLQENDGKKSHWLTLDRWHLLKRLREETTELRHALEQDCSYPEARAVVLREAADVGNFAMMVADQCAALLATEDDSAPTDKP